MIIRTIREEDAQNFLEMSKILDSETQFLLFEPGERETTLKDQRESIKKTLEQENSTILVAETKGSLAGYIAGRGGNARRNRHMVHIVIAILQKHTGKGLGKKLFEALEEWAQEKGIHRLELTLMATNTNAFRLYEKMGFSVEGKKSHVYVIEGEYVDEYMMSKLI
ncbi:GNAT family N-acetyltransferase [Evansella clarkii]|uniref:GNAT family N-acetyltransferase n=1 Tax=Evansella clarkii TaxID=79879 RepID=UPI000B43131E|nr:GNAT family N-acetyltransferase [Evansella clarkii]